MPSARDLITQVVNRGLVPLTKPAGFKKTGFSFHRRRGDTVQVVNVQLSQGNLGSEGGFYVNVGIAFDALRTLEQRAIVQRPPEPECHFRSRLGDLVQDAPDRWTVSERTDPEALAAELRDPFAAAVERFHDRRGMTVAELIRRFRMAELQGTGSLGPNSPAEEAR